VCDRDNAEPRWEKGSLRVVRCRHCSMSYANPVAADLASGEFYDRLGESFYLSPDKLESDFAPVRFEREVRLFRRHCQGGCVLDVGCSTGAFLHSLLSRWPGIYTATGNDVVQSALDRAAQLGVEVIRGSFLQPEFGARRFDAVTFWAVLEHLVEPGKFLAKAASVLRPGGRCFVLVPNVQSLAMRLLGHRYRYVMSEHLNYFSRDTLQRFFETAPDFELVAMESTHFNPIVIWQDLWRHRARVPDEERARLLRRTTAWKQNRFLVPAKALYAALERVLGAFWLADNLAAVLRRR
jgi:2-polyprenyl-3-methyl-5-hydroxy-6-metoxy-1,4-benzoquinol methylase